LRINHLLYRALARKDVVKVLPYIHLHFLEPP